MLHGYAVNEQAQRCCPKRCERVMENQSGGAVSTCGIYDCTSYIHTLRRPNASGCVFENGDDLETPTSDSTRFTGTNDAEVG